MTHVILDGTLIESDRPAGVRENVNDLWFRRKHKAFGGNVQFLSSPNGILLWASDVAPGSTPDVTAARAHVLPALYKAAADGLPALLTMATSAPDRHSRSDAAPERSVRTSPTVTGTRIRLAQRHPGEPTQDR